MDIRGIEHLGYMRVSTDAQETERQRFALYGHECQHIFEDQVSGSVPVKKRTGWNQLMQYAEAGDVVVVDDLDRIGRSTLDILGAVDFLGSRGLEFLCIARPIDTTDPFGRLHLGILAVFAEFEREQCRARALSNIAMRRARGDSIGRPHSLTPELAMQARNCLISGRNWSAVAAVTGLSRRTLQRHFSLMGDALSAVAKDMLEPLARVSAESDDASAD